MIWFQRKMMDDLQFCLIFHVKSVKDAFFSKKYHLNYNMYWILKVNVLIYLFFAFKSVASSLGA